jgi:hypothetical protein
VYAKACLYLLSLLEIIPSEYGPQPGGQAVPPKREQAGVPAGANGTGAW